MPLLLAALVAALILGDDAPAKPSADASPKAAAPADPALAERYKQIIREYEAARARALAAARKAPAGAERREVLRRNLPDQLAFTKRMLDLAETNPRDPAARDALLWALDFVTRGNESAYPAGLQSRTIDLIVEHHADDPEVARIGLEMHNIISRRRDSFLEGIYANAQGHEAKGLARFALAQYLERKAGAVDNAKKFKDRLVTTRLRYTDEQGKPAERNVPFPNESEGYRVGLRMLDAAALRREAERLYREIIDEYAYVPYVTPNLLKQEARLREHPPEKIDDPRLRAVVERSARILADQPASLAQAAADRLAAIRRPSVVERGPSAPLVGMPAPDIDGLTIDGKPMKLSDHRGKVVALVFWGSWCMPCMEEVPRERALVERLKGRPFALLGVACDEKAAALRAIETERMAWPHWTGGGISGRYDVYSFPTVVVLDAKGVIRSMDARGANLDKLVDELLKEMESKDAAKSPAADPP
ncbi:MAG TPA: TlpA disulfide reductase family protein [Isosphaeraceae bacterium]|nr:TlpA disulfide reductase family protein [Isosphaeraceae bacterium]